MCCIYFWFWAGCDYNFWSLSRSKCTWCWNLGCKGSVASINTLFPETHECGSLHTTEEIQLLWDHHAVRTPKSHKDAMCVALVDGFSWAQPLIVPTQAPDMLSNDTFRCFQSQPCRPHPVFRVFPVEVSERQASSAWPCLNSWPKEAWA